MAGKFKPIKEESSNDGENTTTVLKYAFMPHLDFLGCGHFKYPENASNVSPFSRGAIGFQSAVTTVSLTSIGAVCSLDRESAATGLKAIFSKFVSYIITLSLS